MKDDLNKDDLLGMKSGTLGPSNHGLPWNTLVRLETTKGSK